MLNLKYHSECFSNTNLAQKATVSVLQLSTNTAVCGSNWYMLCSCVADGGRVGGIVSSAALTGLELTCGAPFCLCSEGLQTRFLTYSTLSLRRDLKCLSRYTLLVFKKTDVPAGLQLFCIDRWFIWISFWLESCMYLTSSFVPWLSECRACIFKKQI